ncbi:hypothetical protein [Catenulispora subtropica]|uniref:Family 2 encapsulin nanocompartment cargo protein terpene cyclase n=1 Tax=Catenulispora subtropica TaxID=450798 RepID=A0ABN2THD6_9ACTN
MTPGLPPPGPTGIGTSAATLAETSRPARAVAALYCPTAVRTHPALAQQVQHRLHQWADSLGLPPQAIAGHGQLAVLTHPDTDDPARLTTAAQLLAVGKLIEAAAPPPPNPPGPAPVLVQALDIALQEIYDACDTPHTARHPTPAPSPVTSDQPALRSALAALSALPASPYQLDRVRRAYQALAAATPTGSGPHPPWEHLSHAHINAYSPALTALDAIEGYELSPAAAAHPDLQRTQHLAALAAALLQDLAHPAPTGLTAAIARADRLGTPAATRRAAAIHDDTMHAFHHHATELAATADPATGRYLAALWTWLGGHHTFHTAP